jgi:thiamine transport system substrate-binding protein
VRRAIHPAHPIQPIRPTIAARLTAVLCILSLSAAALATTAAAASAAGKKPDVTITLVTHDSFAVSKKVLAAFTKQTGITVKLLPAGDAGAALNQVILTKGAPIGDLLFGVDNTFLSRALQAGIFESYRSPRLASVPAAFQLDARHRVTPIDHGDVCVEYDKQWFTDHKVAVPTSLEDLTKSEYKNLLVAENPATSSPGLAFELATIAHFGTKDWRSYWSKLRANGVEVVNDWNTAYDSDFTAGGGNGGKPLVVSYASDPAAAVYYATGTKPTVSPVGTLDASCFRQVEFVGVLKGTSHPKQARRLVDFMLQRSFQADLPLQMFVYPVRTGTPLPSVFEKYAQVVAEPLSLSAAEIGKQRDQWIEQWTDTVLR